MVSKLVYHFPYYFATVLGASLSILLIFIFESYLEANIFVNYFKSYVIFQVSLILLELGGYTKLQQYIKIDSKSNNIAISLIALQNVIYLTLTFILLVKEGVIFASFFMIQALLYSNYIWYYTAIDKEKSYYLILIIFRILIVMISILLIFEVNILPLLIFLMLGKIFVLLKTEKWKTVNFFSDLLFFFKLNRSVGATNLVSQIGHRFIDISIFQIFPEKELVRIGIIKPILDRLGSMITQHIVNREMVRLAKNLSLFRILKIFSFSTSIIFLIYLSALIFENSLTTINLRDLNTLCILLILTIIHAIIIRLVIFKHKEGWYFYTGIILYTLIAVIIKLKFDFNYFNLLAFILSTNCVIGILILKLNAK